MSDALVAVHPLGGYCLQLVFRNGSSAMVNMENRINTIRFSRLKSPELFKTVKAEGDKLVWSDGTETISIYTNEILDIMMMD